MTTIETQILSKYNLNANELTFRVDNSVITAIFNDNRPNRHFRIEETSKNENGELVNPQDFDLYFFHLGNGLKCEEVI